METGTTTNECKWRGNKHKHNTTASMCTNNNAPTTPVLTLNTANRANAMTNMSRALPHHPLPSHSTHHHPQEHLYLWAATGIVGIVTEIGIMTMTTIRTGTATVTVIEETAIVRAGGNLVSRWRWRWPLSFLISDHFAGRSHQGGGGGAGDHWELESHNSDVSAS